MLIKRMFSSAVIVGAMTLSLNAMDYGDDMYSAWRNGFITGYKAVKTDAEVQGIHNNVIQTKKYVIYFDASGDDIAEWDYLMVQMFGYTNSVNQPVRTENNWIIFASYDNKATATQEMEMLNEKIFKNSEKYKLALFENDKNRVFYNSSALLLKELKDFQALLTRINNQKLEEKKRDLEENQKVLVVYVDPDGKIIDEKNVKGGVTDESSSNATNTQKNKDKKNEINNAEFVSIIKYAKPYGNSVVPIFTKPRYDKAIKTGEILKGEIVELEARNGYNWYKIKGKNLYVGGHLLNFVDKKEYSDNISDITKRINNFVNSSSKSNVIIETNTATNKVTKINKTPSFDNSKKVSVETKNSDTNVIPDVVEPVKVVEKPIEEKTVTFMYKPNSVALYELKNDFVNGKAYTSNDFTFKKMFTNDYENRSYKYTIKNEFGIEYVKLLNENVYVEKSETIAVAN
jgi:hypothetical protein